MQGEFIRCDYEHCSERTESSDSDFAAEWIAIQYRIGHSIASVPHHFCSWLCVRLWTDRFEPKAETRAS